MRKRFSLAVVVTSLALLAVIDVRVDTAAAVSCSSTLSVKTVESVEVQGGTCEITSTTVAGDVINRDGVVTIKNSRIRGNIRSNGGTVRLGGGVTVQGNVSINNATAVGGIAGDNNVIEGSARYSNSADFVLVHYGTIRGTLSIENNSAGVSLVGNSVGQDLVCTGNHPRPTGQDNKSSKSKGQCTQFEKVRYGASIEVHKDGTPR